MKHLAYIILCFVMLCNVHLVNAQGDVKIGKQTWMSKNLDVSTFRNGEAIPEAKSKEEWAKAYKNKTAAFCYYDYDSKNGKVYGKLYNWYAVNDSRGLAPKGYHIPSDAEWTILTDFLGGGDIAGKKMKSKDGWSNGGNGDNSSGFNGLAGGFNYYNGDCDDVGVGGNFGSSSTAPNNLALTRFLKHFDSKVGRGTTGWDWGLSVRCLKD
jgi:uncharacterized protein (TIGR02145 family)